MEWNGTTKTACVCVCVRVCVCGPPPCPLSPPPTPPSSISSQVPIDHAFTLPAFGFFRQAEFEWKQWGHCEKPIDAATRAYVHSLDPVADFNTALQVGE